MPVAFRPEMLALSLESLASAAPSNLPVAIFVDHSGRDLFDEFILVRNKYFPDAYLALREEHIHAPSGTWNILQSIKDGYETGAQYVFLIEEDVRVASDFFTWTYQHITTGEFAATCGRRDRFFYGKHPDMYTNPGACLRRDVLEVLVPHINDDYFTRLRAYLDEHFGEFPEYSELDDGLIRRVILATKGRCKYPGVEDRPKVAHQGFNGYNVLDIYQNRGDVEQRIQGLREMHKHISPEDRYAKDFEPFS
jgi:hypothetical protein